MAVSGAEFSNVISSDIINICGHHYNLVDLLVYSYGLCSILIQYSSVLTNLKTIGVVFIYMATRLKERNTSDSIFYVIFDHP